MSGSERTSRNSTSLLGEFLSKPNTTGAIAPSSAALARMIVEGLDLANASAVLEYGPGTGAFTEQILQSIAPKTKFAAIEINPALADAFHARFPEVKLYRESAVNARSICDREGIRAVDSIVSGLPWAALPRDLQIQLLDATVQVLRPGGHFVTFCYVHTQIFPSALFFAKTLPKYFSKISKSRIVWWNLPPAFVWRCVR